MRSFSLAVRALLFNDQGQLLLLRRSEHSSTNPGTWEIPGGKLDPAEPFDVGLAREVLEEAGIEIELIRPAGTAEQGVKGFNVVHVVMAARPLSNEMRLSEEHDALQWCDLSELHQLDLADWMERYRDEFLSIFGERFRNEVISWTP